MNIRGSRTTYKLIAAIVLMLILVACGSNTPPSSAEPDDPPSDGGGQEAVFAKSLEPIDDYLCRPGEGYVTQIYGTGMGSRDAVEKNPATLTFDDPSSIQQVYTQVMTKGGPDYIRFPAPDYVIFTDQNGNEEVLDSSTVLNPLGRYYEAMLGATSQATAEVVGVGHEGTDDNYFNPRAFIAYVAREGQGNRSSSLNLPHADLWGRADPPRESHEVELAIPAVDAETRRVDITFAVADLQVNDGLIVILEAEAEGQRLSKQYRSANKDNELLIETITLVNVPGSATSVTARVISPEEEISPQTGERFHGPSIHWMGVHASAICEPEPDVAIKKFTNGEDAPDEPGPTIIVGETVTWTYEVTNTGEVPLVNLTVTDDVEGDVCTIDELGVGDTETCELTGTAQAGQYSNTGTVTGEDERGNEVEDEDDSHYFGEEEKIEITFVKKTNGFAANDPNDPDVPQITNQNTVTWTYEVTNTGNVTVPGSDITVSDDQLDDTTIQLVDSSDGDTTALNPGATWVYRATGTALDLTYGEYDATVVDGCDPDGTGVTRVTYRNIGTVTINDLTISNPSHYCNPKDPSYEFDKQTNHESASDPHGKDVPVVAPGEKVKWSYYLTNTGNLSIPRELITISDDQLDDADIKLIRSSDGDLDRLNPDAWWEFEVYGHAVDLSDPNVNVTTVEGCTQGGKSSKRKAYRNIGTANVNGVELSDKSHYCNPEPKHKH